MLLVHCEFSMRVWRGTNHRGQPNPWARSAPRRSRRAYALSFELSPWPACIQALDMPLRLRPRTDPHAVTMMIRHAYIYVARVVRLE